MNIRTAERSDADAIREVAHRSFTPSRVVRPQMIDRILRTRFDETDVDLRLADSETVCVVAEKDGQQVGFAEGSVGDAEVEWLHVVPEHRGEGVGAALFERLTRELRLSGRGQFTDGGQSAGGDEQAATARPVLPTATTADGTALRLDPLDMTAGTEEPFYGVVVDGRPERFGVFCGNCETVVEAEPDESFRCPCCANERRENDADAY